MSMFRKLSLLFSAGCLGGLVNSITVWAFGFYGITATFEVKIAPALTKSWLYPRVVWGGIWAVLLLLPILKRSHVLRGIVLSIAPTLVTLLIDFPSKGKGMLGLELGTLTPLFPLFYNAVWGGVTGAWYSFITRKTFS